jgi:hypothetical protein
MLSKYKGPQKSPIDLAEKESSNKTKKSEKNDNKQASANKRDNKGMP